MDGRSAWVLTEGYVGMENQALGLAEALGLAPEIKRVKLRLPWRRLPPALVLGGLRAPGPDGAGEPEPAKPGGRAGESKPAISITGS